MYPAIKYKSNNINLIWEDKLLNVFVGIVSCQPGQTIFKANVMCIGFINRLMLTCQNIYIHANSSDGWSRVPVAPISCLPGSAQICAAVVVCCQSQTYSYDKNKDKNCPEVWSRSRREGGRGPTEIIKRFRKWYGVRCVSVRLQT